MHIDMKLNFMHILADLGFDGVYPICWIKESKHAKTYTLINMQAKTFKSQTRHNLDKHQVNQEGTQKCNNKKNVQIISRIQINTWFKTNRNQPKDDSKAQQPKTRDTNWNRLERIHDWEGTNWKIKPWVRKPTPQRARSNK